MTYLAAELQAMSDDAIVDYMANEFWWESQYPDDENRFARSAACKDEATRREKPQLYLRAIAIVMGRDE